MIDTPQDPQAERAILGQLISDSDVRDDFIPKIKAGYFYTRNHGVIFNAIKEVYNIQSSLDTLSLCHYLERAGTLEQVGGLHYINSLSENLYNMMTDTEQAYRIIKEKHRLRKLLNLAKAINYSLTSRESSEIISLVDKELFTILEGYDSEERHIADVVDECMVDIVEIQKNGKPKALSTGFASLDSIIIGWESKLYLLFGKSGIGKSAFTLSLIKEASKQKTVYLASLEMPDVTWTERLISNLAGIDGRKLKNGWLGKDDLYRIQTEIVPKIKQMAIMINDKPHTISSLKASVRKVKKKSSLGLIVVDFMQLMQFEESYENNELRYSNLAYQLKALATELNVPILLISSCNKYPENREPRVSDIPYSARVVNACDTIISVHREGYEDQKKNENKFDVHIQKQRSGMLGKLALYFDLPTQSFREPHDGEFLVEEPYEPKKQITKGL